MPTHGSGSLLRNTWRTVWAAEQGKAVSWNSNRPVTQKCPHTAGDRRALIQGVLKGMCAGWQSVKSHNHPPWFLRLPAVPPTRSSVNYENHKPNKLERTSETIWSRSSILPRKKTDFTDEKLTCPRSRSNLGQSLGSKMVCPTEPEVGHWQPRLSAEETIWRPFYFRRL